MKKTTYYLIALIVAGTGFISFWAYQKYFYKEDPELLVFEVERGSISEIIRVRGDVAPQAEYALEFPMAGIIESISVNNGDYVSVGETLAKLDTRELELDMARQEALLAQAEATLAKQSEALFKTIQDSYTKMDDAVRNKMDQLFKNPRSSRPELTPLLLADSAAQKSRVETLRAALEFTMIEWASELSRLSADGDLEAAARTAGENLNQTKTFLDALAFAVTGAEPSSVLPSSTLDNWKTMLAASRAAINSAIAALSTADLAITRAEMNSIKSQISIVEDRLRKSTLFAPESGRVTDVKFKKGEYFRPGSAAVFVAASSNKIRADISELDIGKIRAMNGNAVKIKFDAFPGAEFEGKVISIEPKEVVREGDKYYRTNILFDPKQLEVRTGMSADLEIITAVKTNALKIPAFTLYKEGGKQFTKVIKNGAIEVREVKIGLSDGEYTEILEGLSPEDVVAVSAD